MIIIENDGMKYLRKKILMNRIQIGLKDIINGKKMLSELIMSVGITIVIYILVIGMLIMWDKEK